MVKYTRHTHCDVKVIETDWGGTRIETWMDMETAQKVEQNQVEKDSKKRYGFLHIYTDNLHMVFK